MEPSLSSIPPPPTKSSQAKMKVSVRTHSLLQGCLHPAGGRPKVEIVKRRNKRGESFGEDTTTIASTGTIDSFLATDGQNDFISVLLQEFPSVIRPEVERFFHARQDGSSKTVKDAKSEEDESDGGDLEAVRQHLRQFTEWRKMYGLESSTNPDRGCRSNSINDDREDWRIAWTMMWDQYEQGKELFPPSTTESNTNKVEKKANIKKYPRSQIPQYFFSHELDDNPNEIMLQLLPARIDAYGASPEQHSLACQIYFYRRFNRFNPHQKATLCLDCRGNPGWCNANIFTLKSIISVCTHHLVLYHPGRTKRLVIFPVPRLALKVFEMIKSMLPPVVQKTTQLVAGSERNCDLPKMAEKGGLPLVLLEQMEETRNQEALAAS